ncbi:MULTISPECIES: NUDIX hydrolase [Frankia]|jgi:8-oxo-dGTP pyrophosphatase MutT (NUDIX family)|uniref:NUDIX hydrolase n=1 Tax=Frankia casuarinae (strain DSM 45818 / CECT 9043 / HFP020203 / CcI3) TaxID=106370 RepID=Q2J513_FRACC|nr:MULTISPECIES: NUDIX hydrolase [Frankia]ABD13629.1 NUDIX hydrolase [Frankia casuarinae]OHV49628.1 NUDIX hydrolase [Frankia sp. CgIS1]ORT47887.1 NUDIX hydrolase [Frankia sp. KB5]
MVDHKAALIARLRWSPADGGRRDGVTARHPSAPPAAVRDASTVVLLRDAPGNQGIEAYLLRRAATMAFAGGMYAFPGGRVDPADMGPDVPWAGPSVAEVMHALDADPALARALVCAAVRETFEECGILLAGAVAGEDGRLGGGPEALSDQVRAAERLALERHELGLSALLRKYSLVLRADLLAPWARWVTPEIEPQRYDTRFFVAALPTGQHPGQPSSEADRMQWIRPADALERHRAGTMDMLPPTAFTLAELSEYADVAAVLAAAHARDLSPIMPRILVSGGEARLLLPHDEAYDDPGNHDDLRDAGPADPAWQ